MAAFLIIPTDAALPLASKLFKDYSVTTLDKAKSNGIRASIEGQRVLCWATEDSFEAMHELAIGLCMICPEVKEFTPDPMMPMEAFSAFKDVTKYLASEKKEGRERLKLVTIDKQTVINNGEPSGRQSDAGSLAADLQTPSQPGSPPSYADSPDFGPDSPPLSTAIPDPVKSAPFPPIEAYYEAQYGPMAPLSPELAHSPYRSHAEAVGAAEWPQPTDFWAGVEGTLPEMPPDLMPAAFQDYASHEAETMGADRGIFWAGLIGFCCGALSDAHKLQIKPDNPRWLQAARLWLCVVGSPSTKKTAVLKELDGPAWALELSMRESNIEAERKFQDLEDIYQKQRQTYITKKANGDPADEPGRPPRPNKRRLLLGNATQEALDDVLLDQGETGLLAVSDELASIFGGFNQYKKGGNDKEAYLHGFDGGPYPIDRKGRAVMVSNHGWSILGGTQPNKIRDIAAAIRLESDGMMQRFICYLPRLATEDMDRPAYHEGYDHFRTVLGRLMEMQSTGPVKFSAEAQVIRREFARWNWQLQKADHLGASLSSHVGKYDTFYARMCLVYHAIACADTDNANQWLALEIPPRIAQQVSDLFQECLYPHAAAFYNGVLDSTNDVMLGVRDVASKVLAFDWQEVTPTMLAQEWWGWRKLKEHECKALLGVMCESGWFRSPPGRSYTRGTGIRYQVNPLLRERFAEQIPQEVEHQRALSERRATSNLRPRGKARDD